MENLVQYNFSPEIYKIYSASFIFFCDGTKKETKKGGIEGWVVFFLAHYSPNIRKFQILPRGQITNIFFSFELEKYL